MLGRNVEVGNFRSLLHQLIEEKRGRIIERVGEERGYRYRFADPAMQPYVIMAGIKAGVLTETAKSLFHLRATFLPASLRGLPRNSMPPSAENLRVLRTHPRRF